MTGLLLLIVGTVQQVRIGRLQREMSAQSLRSDWRAAEFILRFERFGPTWFFDAYNPSEAEYISRLQRACIIRDRSGHVLQFSRGFDPPAPPFALTREPRIWSTKKYVPCSGAMGDDRGQSYEVTLGRPVD